MGFDNECIISIQSLPGEYFCPVCRLLVYPNEALQSQCTHLYCKPCLNYTVSTTRACPYDGYLVTEADSKPLTESNKVLSETIGKIAVHCLYHRSGCTWQGPLSDCTSHCSGCAFGNSPVVCNRCGIQIVHRQVQEHAQNCPGVQSQAQQGEGVQEAAATAATQGTDQTQAATQVGTTASQAQTSQTTVVATPGQDPNQQANPNPQAQTGVPTPEQWYQQQQQYQQYYQQYPGYDPYQQQYQQYYAVQQYQQQPAPVPGQHTAQPYMQPQPQVQPQPQAQAQAQVQTQTQTQTQSQPQTQAQHQLHPHGQAPAVAPHQNQQVNLQQQAHPAVHPHSQPQLYPQALPHPQSQPMQPHPQSYPMQPHPQQPLPMPHYQQPHSQTQQAQPNLQHHPLPQPTPHPQAPPQVQIQHHPQPQPQLHPSQPNQPPHPNAQSQATHQSAHAVSGHQSYPHSQPLQQMQLGALQQPSTVMHPQSGPHQQVQNPVQVQAQFLQQPAQMRPPQSQTPMLNQQPPVLLPNTGQVPTILTSQQQQVHPHAHQAGNPGNHRPAMQLNQPPMPQQYVQQQQQQFPFPAQQASSVHSHLNQQGVFVQQQQLPMQSQLRPQASSSLPQHSSAYPQLHSNAAFPHGTQPYQSQNQVGRPMLPNQGVQSQPPGGLAGASQVRPMQLGANQQSLTQNYPIRSSNQGQSSTEQQLGHMHQLSHLPSGGDQLSEKDVGGRENDTNNLVIASGSGDDSVDIKTVKSDNGRKPSNNEDLDEHENKADLSSARAGEIPESIRMLGKDSELNALEKKGPVVKQVIKEEPIDGTLEPSAGGKSVGNVGEDQKTVFNGAPKQVKDSSEDKETQERAENLEEQSRKLDKDPLDDGRIVQLSTGVDKGLQAVPAAATTGPDSSAQTTETNLPRGSGVDESRGFPPPDQFHGRGFTHPSNSVPVTDQGSHQPPPSHYGHSALSQRPSAPAMLHAMPPFGPPHHGQVPGPPPTQLRPQGPGHMAQTGHPLNQADNFQPPGAIPGQGPTIPFGRGPSHSGPPQRSFELQYVAPQGLYNQGPLASSHAGAPRSSQGESVGGPSLGALPPGSFDPHGRAHPHGPEGQMGQQRPNPLDVEMFPNQRHGYFDGRQPDLHHPGSGVPSSMMRMNGPPGLDSSFPPGMRDDRFRHLPEERLNPFPMESGRRIIDRGEFEDDLKQFPRPSHLDSEPVPKFGGYISSSRPVDRGQNSLDKPPHGFNYDTGVKFDPSGTMRPHDAGERSRPGGFHEDNMGRPDFSHTRPDFLGPVPRYGRHHMNGSPVGEYPGMPPRGFGGQSSLDIDGRFGEGSKPFNLHSEPIGPFHESRFFPPHLRRGEHDGPVNLRINERIGQDILPSHLRRDDHLGPRNSHLRLGEPAGFGPFSGHGRAGELAGPGNFPPRFGEPGFRSSYTLQDSGFYMDNMESFDNPRKRRPATMGWCRICKVDCETVEGLDLHSQTREHQKMAMDIVLNIKQQNAKKRKLTSNDHSSAEDASKSKSATIEGRRNKH